MFSARQCRKQLDTLILYWFYSLSSITNKWWFKSASFGAYSRRERRYPYVKGCNSGATKHILWEQIVTCPAHSKEHFTTSLAKYLGREMGRVRQVTPWTDVCMCACVRVCVQVCACMRVWEMVKNKNKYTLERKCKKKEVCDVGY